MAGLSQAIAQTLFKMNPSLRAPSPMLNPAIAGTVLPMKSPEWVSTQQALSQQASQAGLPTFTATPENSSARLQLMDAISRVKAAGVPIKHFIGLPNEPLGDRGVSMDIENLVGALRIQEQSASQAGDILGLQRISRERAYWEKELADSMTAEEWFNQTGERDPVLPMKSPQLVANPELRFDPEGSGFDYKTAFQFGLQPDETGHFGSRVELPKEQLEELGLPQGSGIILKGINHPTFDKTLKGEEEAGFKIVKGPGGRFFSIPKK